MQTTWQRLVAHPERKVYLYDRDRIITAIRAFFHGQDFVELDTPLMVRSPGMEPYLEVFETTLQTAAGRQERAFLLTSPEYAMKKLLVTGIQRAYTICKSFRNGEGISHKHNPEFTIMEWYRTQADYRAIMQDCEDLFVYLAKTLCPQSDPERVVVTYQGKTYDLTPPWKRISVAEAFSRYCNIDTETLLDERALLAKGKEHGFAVDETTTWEQVYNQFFLNDIEPHLGVHAPTIIYDYPASQASLSKKKTNDPRFAERFEFYLAGIEMGNAFTELTDASEQRQRFLKEQEERERLGKTRYDIDEDYLRALEHGLPPTGGIAVGIDRIVMFFANAPSIEDVLVFPATELWSITAQE